MESASTKNHPHARHDWREQYLQKFYFGVPGTLNPSTQWENLVRRFTPQGARVLEIGGGPVEWTTGVARERASEIVGLDIDEVVRRNRLLDEAIVYDGGAFPLASGRFDVAISRWVNEHLDDPELHFREVQRVLAPGGVYVFRTVNLYHYVTMVARLTPRSIQVPLARWLRHMPAEEHDPYPTFYRANTRSRIRNLCDHAGLAPVHLEMSEPYPSYGLSSKALFQIFMGYERLVNSSPRLQGMRHMIDCAARKNGSLGNGS